MIPIQKYSKPLLIILKSNFIAGYNMYKTNWIEFTPKFSHFSLTYDVAGYFDERPLIHACLGWGNLFVHLPIKTGRIECESPRYGVYYLDQNLVFCLGKKNKFFPMPWSLHWVRTSALRKDCVGWEHETRGNKKNFWNKKWENVLWIEKYPFKYVKKNGEVQNRIATVKVEEKEWRWRCFTWFNFPKKISRTIIVNFDGEIGEGAGTWKGGVVGCGYEIKDGETPLDCLRRMEREREFNR
jgi:hypothetical protein